MIKERSTRHAATDVDGDGRADIASVVPGPNMEKVPAVLDVYRLIYSWTSFIFYILFAVTFGFLLAIFWGIVAGVMSFGITWVARPYYKIILLCIQDIVGPIWRTYIFAICNPMFDACGRVFGNIRGRFVASTATISAEHNA